ncbi:type II toxin-antitoxin system VapC family toxin [Mongoliitalea daihaiensis]|uniref:type II toxin-antitoxin system VapC family toxin n=1 Tax=Mongoliitalea daihaiensis TaxID=2782006 RepID=UPI001F2540AE|nr:PIN domain-containing protein [Mongoliitalea daihaiensis]UJP66425.1 type II toxin-antitoxin system VapC family toxin [Mongoliitalea daihaiensis]
MKSKVLIDVNVILDFFLKRNEKNKDLEILFELLDNGKVEGHVTISIIQTCIYFLEKGLGLENTKRIVGVLLERFRLIEGNKKHIFQAIQSDSLDLEDAIHYYIAMDSGIDAIVTNDQNFIKLSSTILPVMSPRAFIETK